MEVQSKLELYLLVCLPILLLHCPYGQAEPVNYCTRRSYPVAVSGVEISPDPVRPGEQATFKISASSKKAISSGELVIEVSYFGIRVHKEKRDLCKEVPCTVKPGSLTISHTQTLPKHTPRGKYTLKMSLVESNEELTCIWFGFEIGSFASISNI